jgi:hypothetical protein
MNLVVFLGPTMPVEEARTILPDALFLPPAKQSDILSIVDQVGPDAVLLIDGVFTQSLSVWHKEILYALEQGVAVYGASSMGALRAAETAVFGAVGVGEIFEAYVSGELTDDDEVAVAHASGEWDHRVLSDAMVNIRATLRKARDEGLIDEAQHDRLVELAKARFFPERAYQQLLDDAEADGFGADVLERLRAFVTTSAVDQKRLDALALLTHIRDQGVTPPPEITTTRSHPFLAQYHRDRLVERNGVQIPLSDISSYAALHLADFPQVNEHALHAALVDVLGELLRVQVTQQDVDAEISRLRAEFRLRSDDDLAAWRSDNDINQQDFTDLMRRLATRRKLREWLISRKYLERTTQEILDELRVRGRYPATADAAVFQQEVLMAAHPDFEHRGDDSALLDLVKQHARHTGWRPTVPLDVWAFENGFKDVSDVRYELVRAKLARRASTRALESLLTAASDDD